jgi:DNA processing protein
LDYRKYVVALREKGRVGPKRFQQLLMSFGSPENIYKTSKEELSSLPRMTPQKVEQIIRSKELLPEIEKDIRRLEKQGIGISTILDDDYPHLLRERACVAVIGTHKGYTKQGIGLAVQIGKELAKRKAVVVSGLAEGIDSSAHLGAISQGGKTYAVLGTGLNKIYPSENVSLAREISKNGALITEYNLDVPVKVGQLMARNRIVVGLSQAVIVVEMDENSAGTMDAANSASKQGKPLFVMGKEGSVKVEELVAEGAVLLKEVDYLDLVTDYL